jgi:hypothetical protein
VTLGSNGKGHTRRPAGAKATGLGSLKARWRPRSVWKRSCGSAWRRGCVASQLRRTSPGRARESHSRRHGPSARQEVNERQISIEGTPPFASGLDVPTSGPARGALRKQGRQTGCFRHPAGTRKVSSSAGFVIEASGASHANREALGALGPRPRTTTCGQAGELRSRCLGVGAHPNQDVRRLRPLGNEWLERDQARGSCEPTLLNQAWWSRALRVRRPSGRLGHDGRSGPCNFTRRSVPEVHVRRRLSQPLWGAEQSRAAGGAYRRSPPCPACDGLPKSPARIAKVSSFGGKRANAPLSRWRRGGCVDASSTMPGRAPRGLGSRGRIGRAGLSGS